MNHGTLRISPNGDVWAIKQRPHGEASEKLGRVQEIAEFMYVGVRDTVAGSHIVTIPYTHAEGVALSLQTYFGTFNAVHWTVEDTREGA